MNTRQILFPVGKLLIAALFMLESSGFIQAQDIEGGGVNTVIFGGVGKAEKFYSNLAYHDAIPLFEMYLKKNDTATTAMVHLGDCFRQTSQFEKAANWYGKALQKPDVDISPIYNLYYAQMLQYMGKYDEAAKWYTQYKELVPADRRSANEIEACRNYGQFLLLRDRYTVKNLGFNCTGYDFSPAMFKGGLVYSSSRDSSRAISRESMWTGTQFFDMWYVEGDKDKFSKPERLLGDAATRFHEGVLSFTPDRKQVYFTRNNFINGRLKMSSDKTVKLKIYRSDVSGGRWKNDSSFIYNNDQYSVGHPALTPDGNTLYFVSDMPGGYGNTDIYVTNMEAGKWTVPQNLGPEINTEGREMFPYVDATGELFFSSDAHGGLGGLDIFRVKKNAASGLWEKIRNLGAPMNSSYDDFGIIYGNDKGYGYLTSNRPDGKGLDDIYMFTDDGIDLEGIVVDGMTGLPICNSKVAIKTKADRIEIDTVTTGCDGHFEFNVIRNNDYAFSGSADAYPTNDSVTATTRDVPPGAKVFVKIPLTKIVETALQINVLGRLPSRDSSGMKILGGVRPMPNSKVFLTSVCEGWTKPFLTDDSGRICVTVRCDCDYTIVANQTGYQPGQASAPHNDADCRTNTICGVNPKQVDVIMERVPVDTNRVIELKDIYYDFNKWNIRIESERELNKLLGFLNDNPTAILELSSHTDARASKEYNQKLSQKRAQSVFDWLVARGIDGNRLRPVGYGESKPRNRCVDGVVCSEKEHQRNRRTEFRVVGGDFELKSLERFDVEVDPCKNCPF